MLAKGAEGKHTHALIYSFANNKMQFLKQLVSCIPKYKEFFIRTHTHACTYVYALIYCRQLERALKV